MDKIDEKGAASDAPAADRQLLTLARKRFTLSAENENNIRVEALDDLKFRSGEQWDSKIKADRALDSRPCLTINRLPQFVRQITNDQRQNRPAIEVSPVDDDSDPETAKIIQGLVRHIEQDSDADAAYDTAFMSAVTSGFGYFRIVTEYEGPDSFDQVVKIKRVRNPFTVYVDPSYQEADGSDMRWGFVVEDYSKDEYKAKWPKSKLGELNDWASVGDNPDDWVMKDGCRVAEYYYTDWKQVVLVKLSDGTIEKEDELDHGGMQITGTSIVDKRTVATPVIQWCTINGIEVLDRTEWLGKWVPLIPVLGDELDIDGRRVLEGIVRHAKDPQRMYNYWASAETEAIALTPRAPYIGAEGQFENHENEWKLANVRNFAYLEYKPKTLGGDPLPPPQRNNFEPAVQAITQARMQASDDLKATTGIYDPSLGNRSNERSGKAILARDNQSKVGNFHFVDNLARAIKYAGRQIVDLIPKVYDGPRVLRIIGDDGAATTVSVNQKPGDAIKRVFDLTAGRYDVVVSTGASYATKRQQAVDSMLALAQAYPAIVQIAGDLLVKNMDWPGAREISDRLRKSLPPGMAEPQPGEKATQIPPQVQEQIKKAQLMIDALSQQLEAVTQKVQTNQLELASKERIAKAEIESKEYMKVMELQTQERIAKVEGVTDAQVALEKLHSEESRHALSTSAEVTMHQRELDHEKELPAIEAEAAPAEPATA